MILLSTAQASLVIFNSSFSSGETLTLSDDTYQLFINQRNNDLLIKSDSGAAYIIGYFDDVIIGNYLFSHDGTEKVGSEIINNSLNSDAQSYLLTRVKLIVSTYEPKLNYDWDVTTTSDLVGGEFTFTFTINNSQEALAQNVHFTHEVPNELFVTDTDDCTLTDNIVSFTVTLDEDDSYTCEYEAIALQSRAAETNFGKITYKTGLQNVTILPEIDMPAVLDPFTIAFTSKYSLNRTEDVNLTIKIANDLEEKLYLRDLELYVPTAYFDLIRSPFTQNYLSSVQKSEANILFSQFTESATSLADEDSQVWFNSSFKAIKNGYVPIEFQFSYEFNDEEYTYGPKKLYYNITTAEVAGSAVSIDASVASVNYTFTLSNISKRNLDTYPTTMENLHIRIYNLCDCNLTNLSINTSFLGKHYVYGKKELLTTGQSYYASLTRVKIPFYLTGVDLPFRANITYVSNGITYVTNVSETITVIEEAGTTLRKTVGDTVVEVSEPVNVTVYARGDFYAPNITFSVMEDLSYLKEHFFVIGPAKRNATFISDEEIVVYKYQLIPLQVFEDTVFTLNTSFNANYYDLLLYNQSIFNTSFDEKNTTHLAWLQTKVANTTAYVISGSLSNTLKVIPRKSGLKVTSKVDSSIVQGNTLRVNYTLENNGTTEITQVNIKPLTSRDFQSVYKANFSLSRLAPGESRDVSFVYRIISANTTVNDSLSSFVASYVTPENVSVTLNGTAFEDIGVVPYNGVIVPSVVQTHNLTSNITQTSMSYTGAGVLAYTVYFTDASSVKSTLEDGELYSHVTNNNSVVKTIVQRFERKEFVVPLTLFTVGKLPTLIQPENDTGTTQVDLQANTNNDSTQLTTAGEDSQSNLTSISLVSEETNFVKKNLRVIIAIVLIFLLIGIVGSIVWRAKYRSHTSMNRHPMELVNSIKYVLEDKVRLLTRFFSRSRKTNSLPKPRQNEIQSEKLRDTHTSVSTISGMREHLSKQRVDIEKLKNAVASAREIKK